MEELIFTSLYFILPAYLANMCPVPAGKLGLPGGTINKKLFGENKTWRGLYSAYLGALIMLFLQQYWQVKGVFEAYRLLDYQNLNLFLYAFLFGGGAILGDLFKSFIKRRVGKKPGESWVPFDQLDLVIGALIFLAPFYVLPWENILVLLLITPLLHLLTNVTAYFLGLKKVWW